MKEVKEQILETALTLFLQKSFKEVTMNDIVEKTGISKGAFYHYYSSKEKVFEAVINRFFSDIMAINYDVLSKTSLKDFYEGYLNELERHGKKLKSISSTKNGKFIANHFMLIFEAIRILPSFSKYIIDLSGTEMNAWMNIIRIARANVEINTKMSDEQIAKHFIYLNDGIGINFTMSGQLPKVRRELQAAWDEFYAMIKT
ncbi:MAG: TetR/AcrR family transcriptional regulator [Prevotellaceae bacterium]|jgi:AcrR family transcriptional regulator|nr:TetR/AcrR family transcriptional regulator [Prevotellaceae bacterium]